MGKNLPKFYLGLRIAPCQLIVCFAERIPKERVATTSISTLTPRRKASSGILSLPDNIQPVIEEYYLSSYAFCSH
jgi:hypothetical protein